MKKRGAPPLPRPEFRLTAPAAGRRPYPSAQFYQPRHDYPGWWPLPKQIKRRSVRLCTLEWHWSPANDRMEAYYLHRSRTHWMLWLRVYLDDDGFPNQDIGIVKCRLSGLCKHDAAMLLLAACLDRARREDEIDRFHSINPFSIKRGLLSPQEIDAVGDVVWRDISEVRTGLAADGM